MIHKRLPGALVALGVLTLAASTAGCGGSATKATPLVTPTTRELADDDRQAEADGFRHRGGRARPAPSGASGTDGGQLALANQELAQAGVSLAGSDGAISGSDVNQAKLQEGSAP